MFLPNINGHFDAMKRTIYLENSRLKNRNLCVMTGTSLITPRNQLEANTEAGCVMEEGDP